MRTNLLLILFLTLWDGRAGLIRAETPVYEAAEGGNITVQCSFILGGSKKTFCKNDCSKQENILVQTSGNSGRNGRYSIKYEGKGLLKNDLMYVSITNVTSSDSGQYQCVREIIIKTGFYEFIIKATKDASLNPTYTLKPNVSSFTVKTTDDIPSSFTVKTTDDIPSFTSVTTTEQSLNQAPVTSKHSSTTSSPAPSGATLYMVVSLFVKVVLLMLPLGIYCWKRFHQNKALWDGRAGLIRAETPVYEAAEGGNITVQCSFYFSGNKKTFCKNKCNKKENILVQTSGNSGRKGRYSIKYEGKGVFSYDLMYVSITNVTSSDSGQYQCVRERKFTTGFYEFIIKVTKDAPLNPTYTLKPNASSFTVKTTDDIPSSSTVKTTDDIPSSSTVKTTDDIPSFTSVTMTEQSLTQAPVTSEHSTTTSSPAPSGASLYVALTLVAVLILFAAALLILCWNKGTNKPKQPPVDTVIPEVNRLYEEIPENNVQRTPRPVEVSTVYTTASFNSTNTDGTPVIYSRVSKQRQVASTSSEEHYSDVDFSRSGPSVNSAPRSQPDQQVLYSSVKILTKDNLYSTVSLPQS